MKYHFKIHEEDNGFWAECLELQGCHTEGNTLEELQKNMEEVLNLYLDEPEDSKVEFPLPLKNIKGKNIVEVAVDTSIAFVVELKFLRRKYNLTQKQVAEKLGMKNIYSYQRLEKKGDPRLSTLSRIKKVFPEFSFNDIFV